MLYGFRMTSQTTASTETAAVEYRYKRTDIGRPYAWREKIAKGKRSGVIQRTAKIEVAPDTAGSVESYVTMLRKAADGLDNAQITTAVECGTYGDRDYDKVYVTGWRDATDEEIVAARATRTEETRRVREFDDAQIARLKASRPEAFA